jgi:hypothetical protein
MKPRRIVLRLAALTLALCATGPSHGQILGGRLPSLPLGLPQPGLDVPDLAGTTLQEAQRLVGQRELRLKNLLREHRDIVEADAHGFPVLRGEVVALSPTPDLIRRAEAEGFRVADRTELKDLDLEVVTLSAPRSLSARAALERLRALDRKGRFELDHLYETSGAVGAGARVGAGTGSTEASAGVRVGMVDTGVPASHPALRGSRVEQRAFAGDAVVPRDHGAAVASLLVGRFAPFRGAAPGAELFVADVYGSAPVGGSSAAIARALGWMAQNRVAVINLSLTGPDDLTLRTVIERLVGRGYLIVSPAGNDGPAAPASYPASYPGVVSVTGVDAHGRVLPEAGRPTHIDFAAPGAEMSAASLSGWSGVRGTSFASPIVAGRLAGLLSSPDPDAARSARGGLARTARPVSLAGRRIPLIGEDLRIAPSVLRP